MHATRLIVIALFHFFLAGCSVVLVEKPGSALLEQAKDARNKKEYARAFELYEEAFIVSRQKNVHSKSLRALGTAYLRGQGIAQNEETGEKLLLQAYALGDEKALASLNKYKAQKAKRSTKKRLKTKRKNYKPYVSKRDVSDLDRAGLEYEASLGNAKAMRWLGHRAHIEAEHEKALEWYRKAAENGDAQSQYILGMALLSGDGTKKDEVAAQIWLNKAKEKGYIADAKALSEWESAR